MWQRSAIQSYFDANIGMAALIAGQSNKAQGKCIDDWFFSDIESATNEVIAVMKRFPDHHPRAIILAVIEKKCGQISPR